MDNREGHKTITATAERAEKQSDSKEEQMKLQKIIQELEQAVNALKSDSKEEQMKLQKIIQELEQAVNALKSDSKEEQMKLQKIIQELEQAVNALKALASGRQSPPKKGPDFQIYSISVHQHVSFDGVRNSLSDLKKRLEEFCEEEFNKIPPHAAAVQIFSPPEPQREEFLKHFCYLTLDPNTTHRNLILSEKNRAMRDSEREQQYSDHPERFDFYKQVLCKESVSLSSYWEVEWSGNYVYISVSYKAISRKGRGDECQFGGNNQSWNLFCSSSSLYFYHNNIRTDLRAPSSSRIGVYVDHSAGTLSFYSVSDTMKLLHRVHTTFTQPLYAGFCLSSGSTVRLCDPE